MAQAIQGAGVAQDRRPVVTGPDVADLAVAWVVDVDAVPLDAAPARARARGAAEQDQLVFRRTRVVR
jgi:hypothetical protein